jgi:hypothetical protein
MSKIYTRFRDVAFKCFLTLNISYEVQKIESDRILGKYPLFVFPSYIFFVKKMEELLYGNSS